MTLEECYQQIGDYKDILGRFQKEDRVKKFVLRFLDDKSFELLTESLKTQNYEEAFRASHTIKGVCQNLSLTKLFQSSNTLTEALRNKQYEGVDQLYEDVKKDYLLTVEMIQKLS